MVERLALPAEVSAFERAYLARTNRVASWLLVAHIPIVAGVAQWNHAGLLLALFSTSLLAAVPAVLARFLSARRLSAVIALAAVGMGVVLVHTGTGPAELAMHLYFFALIALLPVFGNPIVILSAALAVAVHAIAGRVLGDSPAWSVAVEGGLLLLGTPSACLRARALFQEVISTAPKPKPELQLASMAAWSNIDRITRDELGAMLGVEFESTTPDPTTEWPIAAEILVVHVRHGKTGRISIGVEQRTLPRLAELTLGEESLDGEIAFDLVRETANTVGGAFQRAAQGEGAAVTIGLPRDMKEGLVIGEHGRVFAMRSKCGLSLLLRVELLAERIEHVSPKDLREGMVITRDLRGVDGDLLLASGTRITEVVAGRLSETLPANTVVQVSFAA